MSDEIPDLKSMLASASCPWAEVTVPLNQGIRAEIEALEVELQNLAAGMQRKRMGAESPLKAKAREIEAKREQMKASSLTFRFEAPDGDMEDRIRKDLGGRDDEVERDLRWTAETCVQVSGPDGSVFPDRMTWSDFRDLRKSIGEPVYLATIKAASDSVFRRDWSVPFSSAASHILGTET